MFDKYFLTVPFIQEGKIPPNWFYLVKMVLQESTPDNIDLKEKWFESDLEENTGEVPNNKFRFLTIL